MGCIREIHRLQPAHALRGVGVCRLADLGDCGGGGVADSRVNTFEWGLRMRYTVVGVIDGRRLEMPVEASSVVVAIKAAEAEGMVVTDVQESHPDPTTRPVNELAPMPVRSDPKPKGDSPVL